MRRPRRWWLLHAASAALAFAVAMPSLAACLVSLAFLGSPAGVLFALGLAILCAGSTFAFVRLQLAADRLEAGLDFSTGRTCPNCGYDLRGSAGRCPECGRPAPAFGADL